MYLTQALIPYDIAARLKLFNAYDWHQFAWRAFPGREQESRNFLTRLERQERESRFRLLILSASPPQQPDSVTDSAVVWQSKGVSDSFLNHAAYRFKLRVNPTKRDHKTRKRIPLLMQEEQRAWLDRKAQQAGFRVVAESLRLLPEGRQRFRNRTQKKTGLHHAVECQGILVVEQQDLFREAFMRGIGSAKAFGFGLLALVPCALPRDTQ